MRRTLTAGNAAHEVLAREMERTGDALQVLATLTRVLPDDTYLTDFALRDRHLTISGRSASAPRLIGGLAAEPGIRDAAFSAPVTRIEGSAADVFSIAAEAGP
jgi:general secretion pathway protein L